MASGEGLTKPMLAWFGSRPTIRILFYTDDTYVNMDPDVDASRNEFGVRILTDLLETNTAHRSLVDVDLLNRHEGGHANHRLTSQILSKYDEVWFFGINSANTSVQPDNELADAEVVALGQWMADGGVLMSGDHANPRPSTVVDQGLDHLLGLGRAIGHRVPRAGELRDWTGNPGIVEDANTGSYSFNTQVPVNGTPIVSLALQEDQWPQRLILKTYPAASDGPVAAIGRRVHPLFCGEQSPIEIFPDHMHEGRLTVPSTFPSSTWPSGPSGQPVPEVVARGTDKRNGEIYDIVIAYDGDPANVGRVVADSTWHHYFNVNLKGFQQNGPVLPRLAQFYRNLAEWLAPASKRRALARWRLFELLVNPSVVMSLGNTYSVVGRTAASALRGAGGPCVLPELVLAIDSPSTQARLDELPLERALGGIISHVHPMTWDEDVSAEGMSEAVREGLVSAYNEYISEIGTLSARVEDGRDAFLETAQPGSENGKYRT